MQGRLLSPDRRLDQLPASARPHFYLYSAAPASLSKTVNIPDLVRVALTDTKRSLQDYHQKKMFVQGWHQSMIILRKF